MNGQFKFALVILLCSFLYSCKKEETNISTKRVLLVYMGGDNNLSDETYQKINALFKGWDGNPETKIVIYQDPAQEAPRLIEIARGNNGNIKKIIQTYPEENSADPVIWKRVIEDVKSLYPSNHYGLIVFSHASGWLPDQTLTRPRSILLDKKDEMELVDFANAIPDKMFDYILFEACFMAGIEVVYELKDKANYIVASSAEILSPGFTEIYDPAINSLLAYPANLELFTKAAFNCFSSKTTNEQSATFSIIKTSGLDAFASWLRQNINLNKNANLNEIQHFDRYAYHLFFDFGDYFVTLLETEEQKKQLIMHLEQCVIYKMATPSFMLTFDGFEIKKHSGMTTYILQDQYPFLNAEYKKIRWCRDVFGE